MSHQPISGVEYRPICPGASSNPQLGNCYTSPSSTGVALVPKWINVTKVQDYSLSPNPHGIDPYPRSNTEAFFPSCANGGETCGESGQPLCGPWITGGPPPEKWMGCGQQITNIDYNCYIPDPETGVLDFRLCRKLGFKNVQARRQWHGRFGFKHEGNTFFLAGGPDDTGCSSARVERPEPVADQTKYLSMHVTSTYYVHFPDDYPSDTTYTQTVSRGTTVNPHNGVVSLWGSCVTDSGNHLPNTALAQLGKGANPDPQWFYDIWSRNGLGGGRLHVTGTFSNYGRTAHAVAVWSGSEDIGIPNGQLDAVADMNWDAGTISVSYYDTLATLTTTITATWTDTDLTYQLTDLQPEEGGDLDAGDFNQITVVGHLDTPNYASDVYADLTGNLLAQWNLADDRIYPWRTDEYATIAPLVTRNESPGNVQPRIDIGCTMNDPYYVPTGAEPIPQVGWYDYPNNLRYDGSIKGAPLPLGFEHHFAWAHESWDTCLDVDDGGQAWYVASYGARGADNIAGDETDSFMPFGVTQWTNNFEGGFYPPYAWVSYGSLNGNNLVAQKWAEIKIDRPSNNFARPCGKDRYNFDEPTVRCIAAATSGLVTVDITYKGDPGLATNDSVLICGTKNTGIDGGWKITRNTASGYSLSQRLFAFPSGYQSPYDCENGIMGKLRFPNAPALCGQVPVEGATNAFPIVLSLGEDTWLRNGDKVFVEGVQGNSAANGYQTIQVRDKRTIEISGVSGNGVYTHGGYIHSPFAADEKWNDSRPKGEFVYQSWQYDYRSVGEYTKLASQASGTNGCLSAPAPVRATQNANGLSNVISDFVCQTSCLPYKNCSPAVICISPNNERFNNGVTYGFPGFALDERYGNTWQAKVLQTVTDPLWQRPHAPCVNSIAILDDPEEGDEFAPQHVIWNEDDGSCHQDTFDPESFLPVKYYPFEPLVEARCELPSGAPLLPNGINWGCLTYSQLQQPGAIGNVCQPPNVAGYAGFTKYPTTLASPWGYYLRQLSCVCGNFRPDFVDDYEADGVNCSHVLPPP